MKLDSGKVFDNTFGYSYDEEEARKFLLHYFKDDEIENKTILDAGCRTGYYSLGFIKKNAKEVIGIDLSKQCIDLAKKQNKHIKNLKFINGDITNLKNFKDSSFDVVFCVGTIFYLEPRQIQVALKEFLRVTKPSGIILVLFQKEKGLAIKFAKFSANKIPIRLLLFLINNLTFLIKPFTKLLLGRKTSVDYLKYNILGLRGLFLGIPVEIPDKYRIITAATEHSSEKTTASFKILVPENKEQLSFKLI